MDLKKILEKLSNKQPVIVKNSAMSELLADIIIYYLEEEPTSLFSKKYKSVIGKDFKYESALPLYLKYVKGLDCDFKIDRFYTKIVPK